MHSLHHGAHCYIFVAVQLFHHGVSRHIFFGVHLLYCGSFHCILFVAELFHHGVFDNLFTFLCEDVLYNFLPLLIVPQFALFSFSILSCILFMNRHFFAKTFRPIK